MAGKAGMAGMAGKAGNQYVIQELFMMWLEFYKNDKGSTWILVIIIS